MTRHEAEGTKAPASHRLFWPAMLLLPVVFFGLIEAGLRIAGYGSDHALFEPVPGYSAYLSPSPDAGRPYFARTSIVPSPMHDAFRAQKSERALRIFVQGASTAAGFPYGGAGSFSRMLEQRLAATLPDREVEVVNTAMAAVNSYTLRVQVAQVIAQQPDAVLIYAGHNEYYGAMGSASTESFGAATRLYLAIDHLRIVQAARQLWTTLAHRAPRGGADGATLMHELARDRSIPLDSPPYRRGVRQFEANLRAMLCRYDAAGVPVLIGTIASNVRDQPPFVSGFSAATDTASWQEDYRVAAAAAEGEAEGAHTTIAPKRALSILDSLIAIDSLFAQAYFTRARLHESAGRIEEARDDYTAAKDRDELRFRAPEAMNGIIRDAAASCGAKVVDTRAALAAASPNGIIGRERMLEHLHPNVDGYFIIADAFYDALGDAFGPWTNPVPADVARKDLLLTPLDSTLADLHVRRLLNNWPFQPAGVTRPDTIKVSGPVEVLALDVLRGRRTWTDAVASLGAHYEAEGNTLAALRVARALIQERPYTAQPYLLAGNILARMGRYAPAYAYFNAADEQEPSAEARRMAGHVLIRSGRPNEAVPWLHRALELEPEHGGALFDLAVAFAESGRRGDARSTANRLLSLQPEDPGAQRLAARLE